MTHDPKLEEITRRLGKRLQRLALATLRPEDWDRWMALDPAFQPDYAHYRRRMDAVGAQLKAAGVATVEVVVDPDEFVAWADAGGHGYGTDARAHYASLKAMEADGHGNRT
jgi:hypothetical protein